MSSTDVSSPTGAGAQWVGKLPSNARPIAVWAASNAGSPRQIGTSRLPVHDRGSRTLGGQDLTVCRIISPMTAARSSFANGRVLLRATLVGTVLQLAVVWVGHSWPGVARLFAPLGMLISLFAGWLYGRWQTRGGRGAGAVGGLVAGGACTFLGILESFYMKDVSAWVLLFGTASSAVAGAIGGALPRPRRYW